MLGYFDIGDRPTIVIPFFDRTGVASDPLVVKVTTRNPSGTESVYTYPTSGEITRTGVGVYEFQFPQFTTGQSGTWSYRHNGVGGATASFEDTLVVRPSNYTTPLP